MKFFNYTLAVLLAVTVSAQAKPKKPVADPLSAAAIIHSSEEVYAHMKVYLDSGKVISSFYNNDHPGKTAKMFRTAYNDVGGFNFEFYEPGKSNSLYTINRTDNVVRSWWGMFNRSQTHTNLAAALLTAKGVSTLTSYIIPALLLSNIYGNQDIYHTVAFFALEGAEDVNGVDCYKISATSVQYSKFTVWIGKKDFLMRKMETDKNVKPSALPQNVQDKLGPAAASAIMDRKDFSVTETYTFFPYTLPKPNPDLFKFRPNREVAI